MIVNEAEQLIGMVGFTAIRNITFSQKYEPTLTASDVATRSPVSLLAGDGIETCQRLMDANDVRRLPVVEGEGSDRVVGVVHERDAVMAFNRG